MPADQLLGGLGQLYRRLGLMHHSECLVSSVFQLQLFNGMHAGFHRD